MKKIILVTETGSDISYEMAKKYGIYIVPMHIYFGEDMKDDGTFPIEEITNYYEKSGKIPKTSGSNPADYALVFNNIHEKYPDAHIIHLAYSAVTTCSFQSAIIATDGLDYVTSIDTKYVSLGLGAVVLKIAEQYKNNPPQSVDIAIEMAQQVIRNTKMCFIPDNLDYLKAGGRVNNAQALCGQLLNIHPKIEIINGYLKATKKYRGKMKKIIPKLIQDYIEDNELCTKEIWLGYTIGLSDEIKKLAEDTVHNFGFAKVHWNQALGVITTHGGPNSFCIVGYGKEAFI